GERLQSLEAGCNDFLPKPIQSQELLSKIKHYLNLSWIYETNELRTQDESDEPVRLNQRELTKIIMPPMDELRLLKKAAEIGDFEAVENEIVRLNELEPKYASFAAKVGEFANDFDAQKILDLIIKLSG
ncbi:MAG TPA: hybrid sensor histidine kinase/response regulator, partial [Cyanophyceae cyanobacterium]